MIIRYKNFIEAEKDLPRVYRKLCQKKGLDLFLSFPLSVPPQGIPCPKGLVRFKTIEEASRAKEEWILKRKSLKSAGPSMKKA